VARRHRSPAKRARVAAAVAGAFALLLGAGAAGQDPPDAPIEAEGDQSVPDGVEVITVTGKTRERLLEEVPVSATTFTMEDLEAQGTSDIRGLAQFTPNLEIKTVFAASNPTLFIRGVGLKDYFANSSSAVAVYNDDVYMNSPTGQLFQLFDLENVEVLRGPQGSLYGRNASAGVIRAISRKPTGFYNGYVSGSYGSYDLFELESALEFPVVEEKLAFRGAFRMNQRDGVAKNRCAKPEFRFSNPCSLPGSPLLADIEEDVNDVDNWAARGILRWTPRSDVDVVLNAGGGLNRSLARQNQKIGTSENPQTGLKTAGNQDRAQYRDPDTCTPGKCLRVRPQFAFPTTPGETNPLDGDPYKGDYNLTEDEDVDVFLSSLTAKYEPSDSFSLSSVTAYASNQRDTHDNADASPRLQVEVEWFNEAWQASEEVRASWVAADVLYLTTGAFFLTEQLDVDNGFTFPSFSNTGRTTIQQILDQDTYTWSVFGHGSWDVVDDLTLEGGLRYNWDQKKFTADTNTFLGTIFFKGPVESEKEISKGFSGDVSMNYQLFDNYAVYGKYGRGFKAGQFNGAAGLGNFEIDLVQFVEPETVDAYEAGFKSNFLDRRVLFNAAAFFYRYNDLQVFVLDNSLATLPTPRLVNANDAQVWGLEADVRIRPLEWLEIFTNIGFLESEYLDFTDTVNTVVNTPTPELVKDVVDYSGNRLINSPVFSASGALVLNIPLGRFGWLSPRFDYSYKSEVYFDPNEGRGQFGFFPRGTLSQGDLWLFNARLAYRTVDERIEVAAFVRNLTDEEYIVDGFDLSAGFDALHFVIGDPRLIGGSVSFHF
jgi:iron complex outermembrane receptor protein